MTDQNIFASLTRLSDLQEQDFRVKPLERSEWATGDYVLGEVEYGSPQLRQIELWNGRMCTVAPGDRVIGALGFRAATLEAVGSWEDIGENGRMEALTSAGLFGRMTSRSPLLPSLTTYSYRGHIVVDGRKRTMAEYVHTVRDAKFSTPTVLIIGTSMSAGKTTAGTKIIRMLKARGLRVAAAKLTGAGRYRDILAFGDAGADTIHDFVDVGLPSSICERSEYDAALENLLAMIQAAEADVLVAEAGASPHEPYNGEAAMERLAENVACVVLAASDPYAVVGVTQAFDMAPDIVTGLATTTTAGVALVEGLTGFRAINLLERAESEVLGAILDEHLAKAGVI